MKISNSKRQLARLITLDGGWKDGSFAAQEQNGFIYFYFDRPRKSGAFWHGSATPTPSIKVARLPNWHQTVLSRDEFDRIVAETVVQAEPDSDGWIKWRGGECPVADDCVVDYRMSATNGDNHLTNEAGNLMWSGVNKPFNIIAYRLHKPERVEPVAAKPTLDQLLQDWRNADDYAQRKQTEADEAAAMRDERWQAVQVRAGEMSVTVGRCDSVAAGDVQSVKIGGEIIATRVVNVERLEGRKGKVLKIDSTAYHGPLLVKFPDDGTYWVKEWQLDRP